jgi:hypothetical protein
MKAVLASERWAIAAAILANEECQLRPGCVLKLILPTFQLNGDLRCPGGYGGKGLSLAQGFAPQGFSARPRE